ncbi:MAG: toll/interleukin-1 receptor domain-containing protein [Pseudomonadota bacterium]
MSIFMSYRRADSADVSGRIRDHLVNEFGQDAVFKDVIDIDAGVDFREKIRAALKESDVFLLVIGKHWLGMKDSSGNRRIDNPADVVRLEIEWAREFKVPIIPLLVTGATMPDSRELPESLKRIADLNAHTVRPDPDFQQDMLSLSKGIKHHMDWVVRHRMRYVVRARRIVRGIAKVLPNRVVLQRAAYMLLGCLLVGAAGGWILDELNDYDDDFLILGGILGLLFYLYYSLFERWTRYGASGFMARHAKTQKE